MSDDRRADDFMSTREAAEMLGVALRTVQLWVEAGVLTAWKTAGGHRRVVRTSVEALLKQKAAALAAVPVASRGARAAEAAYRVLVIEDEPALLKLYSMSIGGWDLPIELLTAGDGFEGLLRIGEKRPDLVITDLRMPGMDGFQMLRSVRATRGIPRPAGDRRHRARTARDRRPRGPAGRHRRVHQAGAVPRARAPHPRADRGTPRRPRRRGHRAALDPGPAGSPRAIPRPPARGFPAAARPVPAVLFRVDRRRARLHDAGDGFGVADGHADAVAADGRAGADGEHGPHAAVRPARRRARRHRRPAPRDPRHADRAARDDRADRRRHARRGDGAGDAAAADLRHRQRLHVLHARAAGEHQRPRRPRRALARGRAERRRLQRRAGDRPGARRRDRGVGELGQRAAALARCSSSR